MQVMASLQLSTNISPESPRMPTARTSVAVKSQDLICQPIQLGKVGLLTLSVASYEATDS